MLNVVTSVFYFVTTEHEERADHLREHERMAYMYMDEDEAERTRDISNLEQLCGQADLIRPYERSPYYFKGKNMATYRCIFLSLSSSTGAPL